MKNGQSLVEVLVMILASITSVKLLFIFMTIILQTSWLKHQLYQFLLCRVGDGVSCEARFVNNFEHFLPVGQVSPIQIKNNQASIVWQFYKFKINIKESLVLP